MELPIRLKIQPLIESTIELRFDEPSISIVDRLPALVFTKLAGVFTSSEITPVASLPKEVRDKDPNLWYAQNFRILGSGYLLYFGDRVVGISRHSPYCGWVEFKAKALEIFNVLIESNLLPPVVRFSMKAVNILPSLRKTQLEMLTLKIDIGGVSPVDSGFNIRAELRGDRYIKILEITPNVAAQQNEFKTSGLLISVDCINYKCSNGVRIEDVIYELDLLHDETKRQFFELLSVDVLQELEPEYK